MGNQINFINSLGNSGPLKAEPSGTLYKNKRNIEKETLYKVFPLSLNTVSADDPDYKWFIKESQKLNKLLEDLNPNLEKILSTGITEKGNQPFVESEPVDGPSLEELTSEPYISILSFEEILEIACQLSNALAHIHTKDILHGQVNLSNIRHHLKSGQYILTGFGSNLISPQYRPDMSFNEELVTQKHNFFKTDLHDYGVLLYQLLTGKIILPDDLKLVKNRDALASLILVLRKEKFPSDWDKERKDLELNLPEWLFNLISGCLEFNNSKGFANGSDLKEFLVNHCKTSDDLIIPQDTDLHVGLSSVLTFELKEKDQEITKLKALVAQKEGQLNVFKYQSEEFSKKKRLVLSTPAFFSLLFLILVLASIAVYSLFFSKPETKDSITVYSDPESNSKLKYSASSKQIDSAAFADSVNRTLNMGIDSVIKKYQEKNTVKEIEQPAIPDNATPERNTAPINKLKNNLKQTNIPKKSKYKPEESEADYVRTVKYSVAVPKAYFYEEPDVRTKKPLYLSADTGNTELTASQDLNGFIYVVFFNTEGEITKGWLRKQDLRASY